MAGNGERVLNLNVKVKWHKEKCMGKFDRYRTVLTINVEVWEILTVPICL